MIPIRGVLGATFTATEMWMIVVILVILVLLSFLALAETAINRISMPRAQSLAEESGKPGRSLVRLVAERERFLNPVQLTVTALRTVQAVLTGFVAGRIYGFTGVLVATLLNVVVFFVFAESLPKTWAVLHTDRSALMSVRPVSALVRFWPLSVLTRALIGITNILIPGKGLAKGPFVSEKELLGIVQTAADEDVIEHGERELIESVIEFGDTIVREVMVPRADMVTTSGEGDITMAMDVAIKRGFSRLPVTGDSVDDIVGVAYAKDLMRVERAGRGADSVRSIMRPPRFVPETKKVDQLLEDMQTGKYHLAIVVDEYGGTAGLVTMEDLLEELVGEIRDEFDREEPTHEELPGGAVRVQGRMSISELNYLLDAELPDDDWDTVGGLILNTLGHVPLAGESVELGGYRFRVERVQGRRITRVRIAPEVLNVSDR